ncbi:uncharacterized protein BXZ73DRAFT_49945 [Epithele typhae]|uniref:uncharacterized protein n=1 Tax=Epithele typhae TaxID=378194 RepID=UPI0020072110|nr:uncharacterized protein BXZ73DRAFT_49945 [Epithele typhae]KAH9925666.1 hypothetical protein BXZ73DRAFT_49945 [Epithele typhae]
MIPDDPITCIPDEFPPERRDAELWIEDGTLVLAVEDTAFRVYKGLLKIHSPVFKDMLALPTSLLPAGVTVGTTVVDGEKCTVVRLPDSAREWRYVLRVLVVGDGRTLKCVLNLSRSGSDLFLMVLLAYIRLGHKYKIEDVYRRSLKALKGVLKPRWSFSARPRLLPSYALCVVNIARLTGEPSLLPYAMLLCSRGVSPAFTGYIVHSDGKKEDLNEEDDTRCIQATRKLVLLTLSAITEVVLPPMTCKEGRKCQKMMDTLARTLLPTVMNPMSPGPMDPMLWSVVRSEEFRLAQKMLCASCWDQLSFFRVRKQREEVWNMLPSLFDISSDEEYKANH